MLWIDDIACVPASELLDNTEGEPIMSKSTYDQLVYRHKLTVVRRGVGRGNRAMIAYASLPERYRREYDNRYKTDDMMMQTVYNDYYRHDDAAVTYYAGYKTADGRMLERGKVVEYATNASVIGALVRLMDDTNRLRAAGRENRLRWDELTAAAAYYNDRYRSTLPTSPARLRDKVAAYRREGYASLVSGKMGNRHARKVDDKVEHLVMMLAVRRNQPFAAQIYDDYNAFVRGEIEVVDPESGEVLSPTDYTRKGQPLRLSKRTIDGIITRPANALLINATRKSRTRLMHEDLPHNRRHTGVYSLSKVSADDRDLPRVERGTKVRPKAYYLYDVLSGVVIGHAYSRSKDIDLVTDMFRDAFRFLDRHGLGVPAQIEVENHLMSQWRDGFLQAGKVFDFVRFCAPQNSQEKHAEQLNGAKKKLVEHRQQAGIGRWYARYGAYKTESRKVSDAGNDTWEEQRYYSWDELIADDLRAIETWNNSLHSDQRRYPGKTRMQVLLDNVNPNLRPLAPHLLSMYIGERVDTTIRRGACRVAGHDYRFGDVKAIEQLKPSKAEVTAYYIPNGNDVPREVYVYQGDTYIDTMPLIERYNEFAAERTERDRRLLGEQIGYRKSYERYIADNLPTAAVVLQPGQAATEASMRDNAEAVELPDRVDDAADGQPRMSIEDIARKGLTDI